MIDSPSAHPKGLFPGTLKEPFCALSHYTGAVLSAITLAAFLIAARGRFWPTLGGGIYGLSLITLYLASALSHSWQAAPRVQNWLSRFDYVAIFLLIAGSYAPVCLIPLHGRVGWTVLGVEYGLALIGISNVLFRDRTPHWIRVILYVIMGWLIVAVWPLVQHALPEPARVWMIAGGLSYSLGVAVLALDKPHLWPGKFSAHDLWHVFVLAGSACHVILVYRYIIAP